MLAAVLLVLPALAPVRESDPKPVMPPSEEAVKKWGKGDILVVADLTSAREGPSLPTNPPQYNTVLALKVSEPLRGALKKDATASGNLRTKGEKPTLTVGKKHLVSLTTDRGGYRVEEIEELTDDNLKDARAVAAMPRGWSVEGKEFVSPWAALGKEVWPEGVLWDESVVIVCQGKAYPAPGAAGLPEKAKPVELKAGESISGTVNELRLEGPEWPRGGYRIEFLFCLGEKASNQSFYYYSKHHDAIRAALGAK
jgi:hypothetical protein